MRTSIKLSTEFIKHLIEIEASKGTKGLILLSELTYNKCIGYSIKRLCEAAGITPSNFQSQFKSHIANNTIKKIGKFWYINPNHIFYGDAKTEAVFTSLFNNNKLKHLSELSLEDLAEIKNKQRLKLSTSVSNNECESEYLEELINS